jgi:pimeloyl-ACP methyl ester carboxylesterase
MPRSSPVDGFRLAYDRAGSGRPVVLLHGWPGDRHDYREVLPLLSDGADIVVPDLRGFGESDKHPLRPSEAYSGAAQARSIIGLIEELSWCEVVLGGYDIGSRVAQAIAQTRPDLIEGLVISPPVPGAGARVLSAGSQREFWYQAFHQLDLATELIDGSRAAVHAYLKHFWSHWSGPAYMPSGVELERLAALYSAPGAFTASIGWYRASSGTVVRSLAESSEPPPDPITPPAIVLWPAHDPLFPAAWSDRLDRYFSDATLTQLPDAGHFVPLESPHAFAAAIRETAGRRRRRASGR